MSLAGFKASNHPQQTGKRGAVDAVDDRGTDQAFFDTLSKRFGGFTLDVAAAPHNAKCDRFYTIADDGLSQRWGRFDPLPRSAENRDRLWEQFKQGNEVIWCNPPYSDVRAWVEKAWLEHHGHIPGSPECQCHSLSTYRNGNPPPTIVMLLPANRVEQAWWQDLVEPYRDAPGSPLRVEFLRGRMRFDRPGWTKPVKGDRPPFGCCLLIWGHG